MTGTPLDLTAAEIGFGSDASDRARADRLAAEIERERARREARRVLDAEERGAVALPEPSTLAECLARPIPAVSWRIERLFPAGGRAMLAAQYKAGKTTLVGNVLRSMIDGSPFLGRYPVAPLAGALALLDFEMSERQLIAWLRDQGIVGTDRLLVLSLRGKAASFNLTEDAIRDGWAGLLRRYGVSFVVWDCVRPVIDALGLDENRDAGKLLSAFDALLTQAGIPEALVVQHMGHTGERARGDSRFRDWPDCEWRLVRQDDDPASPRFLTAFGRDVDEPEMRLSFDPQTRHLSVAGGTRRDARLGAVLDGVVDAIRTAGKPLGVRAVQAALQDEHGRDDIRAALQLGVRTSVLETEPGPRGARLHRLCDRAGLCGQRAAHSDEQTVRVCGGSIGAARRTVVPEVDGVF